MTQAIVDPEMLRSFARSLRHFNAELEKLTGGLSHQLASLSTTWRDQEHRKFVEQFE